MFSSCDVLRQERHGLRDFRLWSYAPDGSPGALVVRNRCGRVDVIGYEFAGGAAWLPEQHERVAALDRIRDDRHRANAAYVVGQLHEVARSYTQFCGISGVNLEMRHRIVVVVERDVLVVVERLPDVVRTAVIHPEWVSPTLGGDLRAIPRPGLRRRDEPRFPRWSMEAAMLMHANRADRNPVDDARWRLNSVGAEPPKKVVGHARITFDRVASIALELIARVDEDILLGPPIEIEEAVGHQRVVVLEIERPDPAREAGDDLPVRQRLTRRVHEALIEPQPSFAIDRREVGLSPLGRRQHEVRESRRRGHVDVLANDEHAALLQRVHDPGDTLADRASFGAI